MYRASFKCTVTHKSIITPIIIIYYTTTTMTMMTTTTTTTTTTIIPRLVRFYYNSEFFLKARVRTSRKKNHFRCSLFSTLSYYVRSIHGYDFCRFSIPPCYFIFFNFIEFFVNNDRRRKPSAYVIFYLYYCAELNSSQILHFTYNNKIKIHYVSLYNDVCIYIYIYMCTHTHTLGFVKRIIKWVLYDYFIITESKEVFFFNL